MLVFEYFCELFTYARFTASWKTCQRDDTLLHFCIVGYYTHVQQITAIFLGTQGCGKGTQIQLLKDHIATIDPSRIIVHLEMGNTLRELAKHENYAGHLVSETLAAGDLVPFAISASTFTQYLVDHVVKGDEHIIIDGYPRSKEQIPTLESAITFYKRQAPVVLHIHISEEEAFKRVMARMRHDDTEESIRRRLDWSREHTLPNLAYFKENPRYRVVEIFGERSVEEVQHDIRKELGLI